MTASAETPRPAMPRGDGGMAPVIFTGLCVTFAFYCALTLLPRNEFLTRYFCSHPLEYVTTAFFFIGLTILAAKAMRLPREGRAFNVPLPFDGADNAESAAKQIDAAVEKMDSGLQRTHLLQRVQDFTTYVRQRPASSNPEEHLRYLAELAGERLHGSYSLVRTVTWAVPILGFLGTVIGITMAIANVTPEQLDTSLGEVTGGLAVAFDTTALALALSIVLVFASFLVERAEQQILERVELFGIRRLAPLCASSNRLESDHPVLQQFMDRTQEMLERQTQVWNQQLDEMRSRWIEALQTQSSRLNEELTQQTLQLVTGQAGELDSIRETILQGFREAIDGFAGRMQSMSDNTTMRIDQWQRTLHDNSEMSHAQMQILQQQSQQLLSLLQNGDQLAHLQQSLNRNLEAVRAAESFDEALHNLNAAIHLLTTRIRPKAA